MSAVHSKRMCHFSDFKQDKLTSSSFRAPGVCCPQQASCCGWSYNHRLHVQFIDLKHLLSTASVTSGISSRTSSHPPVFVPQGSAVHSRRHVVDGVITIDFACCLSTSNVCCPQQMYVSLLGFRAGQAHILQFSCPGGLLSTAGIMLWMEL